MSEYAFIHIPKNAGFSVKNGLQSGNVQIFDHGVLFNHIPIHLKQIIIIREPADRFASAFFYIKHNYFKRTKYSDPEVFIQALLRGEQETCRVLRPQPHFHVINGRRINTDWVFNPQIDWVDKPHKIFLYGDTLRQNFREIGLELPRGKWNMSRKVDFTYSKESLEYLHRTYRRDYILYNKVKEGKHESYCYRDNGTGRKPPNRSTP